MRENETSYLIQIWTSGLFSQRRYIIWTNIQEFLTNLDLRVLKWQKHLCLRQLLTSQQMERSSEVVEGNKTFKSSIRSVETPNKKEASVDVSWVCNSIHINRNSLLAHLRSRPPSCTEPYSKRKRAISVCLRRKSDVPWIKSQRFIIQVFDLLCYFRLISNIDRVCIIYWTRKKRDFADSVPIHNAGV